MEAERIKGVPIYYALYPILVCFPCFRGEVLNSAAGLASIVLSSVAVLRSRLERRSSNLSR
jgi:hypothetical protein